MQSVCHGLRTVSRRRSYLVALQQLQPHQVASSSRSQWDSRRAYAWNPLDWIRQQAQPKVREKDSARDIEDAREKLRASGEASIFETQGAIAADEDGTKSHLKAKVKPPFHKFSTGTMTISHRKLNDLARQVAGKPIDAAILQMVFSEKRVSNRLKNMLVVARNHATEKGLKREKLVVAEAWVNKGPGGQAAKRLEIKGRGKFGIRTKPKARMHVVLKEGQTIAQTKKKDMERKLKRIVSAGMVREDVPLRNPAPTWAW